MVRGRDRAVVYFPACVARTMGPAPGDPDPRNVTEAMLSVLEKAGYDVRFPPGLDGLCCGLSFESKGFPRTADEKTRELEARAPRRHRGRQLPVVCDTSPCAQRMKATLDPRLAVFESAEFVHDRLMERLRFAKAPGPVALHVTCSTTKMGLEAKLRALAAACAESVVVPPTGCCGFAGRQGVHDAGAQRLGAAGPPRRGEGVRPRVLQFPRVRDRARHARRDPVPVAPSPRGRLHDRSLDPMTTQHAPLVLAVVGVTGAVGRTLLEVLDDLDVSVKTLRPFASPRSAGTTVAFRDDDLKVEVLREGAFRGCDVAIFCAGPAVSREWAPRAWAEGCAVVDDSPAFRGEADVPLVVPEVNGAAAAHYRARGIVANPSSVATALSLALAPLRDAAGLRRVVVSTYHSASGLGQAGVEELEKQARDLLNLREPDPAARFPHRLAFNVIPQVGAFAEGGATEEESKIVSETRKILGEDTLAISATAVRVPVFFGHSATVNVATQRPLGAAGARAALLAARGVKVVDDPAQRVYPMPMLVGSEDVALVGRLREDRSQENGLDLFVSIENTRKGAATNAVQIAQLLAPRGR